ncbi:MAG: YeeE/YedE thiosulfate transporter family protein [Polyangiaceae bacterium]
MMPFYQLGGFEYPVAMLLATVLGIAFGFVLERAGFGRADVLVGQFHGTDMRVLKVMFSAIATTAVGIGVLSGVGLMDVSKLVIPATYLWPQLVGGLLLGVGFVVSGYCPGTAVVSAASGHVDALYSLVGVTAGSLGFALVYPLLERFYESGAMGPVTLPSLLGVPWAALALGVALIAIGAFALGERLEKVFARRSNIGAVVDSAQTRNRVLGGLLLASVVGLATLLVPTPKKSAPATQQLATVEPLDLAQRLADAPDEIYLVDLRDAAACEAGTLPHAVCVPADDPQASFLAKLPPTRTLVLFDEEDVVDVPRAALGYQGSVKTVAGGRRRFAQTVLTAPTPPERPTPQALSEYRLRAALHGRFTGQRSKVDAPASPMKAVTRAGKKGGGC